MSFRCQKCMEQVRNENVECKVCEGSGVDGDRIPVGTPTGYVQTCERCKGLGHRIIVNTLHTVPIKRDGKGIGILEVCGDCYPEVRGMSNDAKITAKLLFIRTQKRRMEKKNANRRK